MRGGEEEPGDPDRGPLGLMSACGLPTMRSAEEAVVVRVHLPMQRFADRPAALEAATLLPTGP